MKLSSRDKWIFLSLMTICAIITIAIPVLTQSIHNAWYGVEGVLFIGGAYNISLGAKKLRTVHQNGEKAIWYKEYMIDIGIMGLLFGFLELVMYGVSDYLSASIGVNITYGLIGMMGVGALFFFILSMKYRPNRVRVMEGGARITEGGASPPLRQDV